MQALLSCSIMPQIYPQETFLAAQSSCDAKKKENDWTSIIGFKCAVCV